MKNLPFLLCVLAAPLLTNCTVAHGNAQSGQWTLAALGSDIQNVSVSAEGVAAEKMENSKGLSLVKDAVTSVNAWKQIGKIGTGAISGATKVLKSRETTKRVGLVESNLTQRQQITSQVEQARIGYYLQNP